mgnify:CR=1 FL=1
MELFTYSEEKVFFGSPIRLPIKKIKNDKRSKIFDVMLFSAEVHLDKKTKEFFYEASSRADVEPRYCVFVDDSEKNILFAKSLGFQAYKFTNTADLIDSFE